MAALRRFVARCGQPQRIHSDCGTIFIGPKHQLKSFAQALVSKSISSDIIDYCASMGTEWSLIPERAPNFGGLWESTVMSVKKHFSATTNGKSFAFEEMSTLLAQIEAVLNSRPFMPISFDDTDLSVLNPGHFLIGQPITSLPDRDYSNMRILRRWNLVQKTIQYFWRRWSNEYLTSLNHHQKWRKPHHNVQISYLVLIKDENIFHCQWPLARVIKVFPGEIGRVRVADVKTMRGIYHRPTNKLVVLLTQEEAISQDAPSGGSMVESLPSGTSA